MSIGVFTKEVIYNLFHKPATEKYPFVTREYGERTRGHIENDMNACVLCGMCMMRCPSHAIKVDRNAYTWSINPFSCVQCSYCVEGCPKKCLSMKNTYTTPDTAKNTVTLKYSDERIRAEEEKKKEMIAKAMAAKKAAAEKAAAAAKTAAETPKAAAGTAGTTEKG
ncbi:MAG: 4Fe-4S dicluster domain-containing protein [Lachnospiraceae bacterium]|jgi:ech hydrogenase subunit F|nr:4Fe-4S dicluster domain-containing protein [Lachnospiraceae bacterium]